MFTSKLKEWFVCRLGVLLVSFTFTYLTILFYFFKYPWSLNLLDLKRPDLGWFGQLCLPVVFGTHSVTGVAGGHCAGGAPQVLYVLCTCCVSFVGTEEGHACG